MASLVIHALESAKYEGSSSQNAYYWAFQHPNPDAPPQTYRLTRRHRNGWMLLLAASKETHEVLSFHADTPEDQAAVGEALSWLGIAGKIESSGDGIFLQLPDGTRIRSQMAGGEKPKK